MAHEAHEDVERVLWSEENIAAAVAGLGRDLAAEYAERRPLLLVTLSGATTFAADLARQMQPVPRGLQVDYIRASSYLSATTSAGHVQLQVREWRCSRVSHNPAGLPADSTARAGLLQNRCTGAARDRRGGHHRHWAHAGGAGGSGARAWSCIRVHFGAAEQSEAARGQRFSRPRLLRVP